MAYSTDATLLLKGHIHELKIKYVIVKLTAQHYSCQKIQIANRVLQVQRNKKLNGTRGRGSTKG